MEIDQFRTQLISALSSLDYIESINISEVKESKFIGTVRVRRSYVLSIRFKLFQGILTLSFTLIFENKRIWGLDKDNRAGWHIHPLHDVTNHEPIEPKKVHEIVMEFDRIVRQLIE